MSLSGSFHTPNPQISAASGYRLADEHAGFSPVRGLISSHSAPFCAGTEPVEKLLLLLSHNRLQSVFMRNYGRGAGKTPPTVGVTLSPNGSGRSLDSDAEQTELL